MIDPRTASVIAAITARFPGTTIEIHPNVAPELPTIPDHLFVLDVPIPQLHEVTSFALNVAFAVFGDEQPPFLIGAIDPEQSAKYFKRGALEGRVAEA